MVTIRDVCTYGGTVVPCPTAGGGPRVTRLTGGARCAGCLPSGGVSATGTQGGCYIVCTAGESCWTYCTGGCLSENNKQTLAIRETINLIFHYTYIKQCWKRILKNKFRIEL